MRTTICAGLIAMGLLAGGQAQAEASSPPVAEQLTTPTGQQSPGVTQDNFKRVTIDDLRKEFSWTQGKSDADIVLALAKQTGRAPDFVADQLGLNPEDYYKYNNPGMAGGESSIQQPAQENMALSLDGGSKAGAGIAVLIAVALGGGIGYLLRKLVAPKHPPSSPNDTARAWLGWAIVPVSAIQLSRFFLYLEPAYLAVWLIGMVMLGGSAYALGLLYGKYKFGPVVATSAPTTGILPPTADQAEVDVPTVAQQSPVAPAEPSCPTSDSIYARIADELESGNTDKGLWTRLWAECGGDDTQTRVQYIKHRAEALAGVRI